ncbi:glycosyltransferase family 2 protein [Desulfococcaceae bacterium HSG9]|nr:glycosyltransferase family 2 protein [Desulfococcaceae bacterium HSG9]
MIIINAIILAGALYITLSTVYLLILTLAAYGFKKTTPKASSPVKMAVVVPAHNESLGITTTVRSVQNSQHPSELITTFVIADNCDDGTDSLAESAGACVFERTDTENRGKGQALDWLFSVHRDEFKAFDAVVIIDADTLLHPAFLSEIASSLSCDNVKAVQGYYGFANPEDNWRTALASAALNVFHHLRPAGRNRIGGTAGLRGNGMAFKTEIIARYGWPCHSIVEDIEFSMRLLLDDISVHYNPDAIVYGEMATERKQAETQRKRWEGGRSQMLKMFAWPLLKAFFTKGGVRWIDSLMELVTPPLSLLIFGQIIFFVATGMMHPQLWPVLLILFLIIPFYVISGLVLKKAPFYIWKCLLAAPFFMLWKIPIYLRIISSKDDKKWERTLRKGEVDVKGDE